MRSKEPVEGTDIVWSCQPLIHDNERLSGKVASLTLALQAAHKGIARLKQRDETNHFLKKEIKKLREENHWLSRRAQLFSDLTRGHAEFKHAYDSITKQILEEQKRLDDHMAD